jgi:hypothetical protein
MLGINGMKHLATRKIMVEIMDNFLQTIAQIWFVGFLVAMFTAPTWAHAIGWPLWVYKAIIG